MSFTELLENLETLTPEQREIVIKRVIELDEREFSPEQEAVVRGRREQDRKSPESFISIDELERRLNFSGS